MKIALDLDNTLIDILTPWLKVVNTRENSNYTFKDIDTYDHPLVMKHDDFIHSHDMYDNLVPDEKAISFFNDMKKRYEVSIVTHTLDGHKNSKIKFIDTYFPGVDVCMTGSDNSKFLIDKVLMDDRPSNVESHVNNGYHGILFTLEGKLAYSKTSNPKVLLADHYHDASNLIRRIENGWSR